MSKQEYCGKAEAKARKLNQVLAKSQEQNILIFFPCLRIRESKSLPPLSHSEERSVFIVNGSQSIMKVKKEANTHKSANHKLFPQIN